MTALKTAKRDLRKLIRKALLEVPADTVASQTSNVVQALLSSPEYQSANRLSVYLSMHQGEIATHAIVQDALQHRKKVFVPYTHRVPDARQGQPSSIMDMVTLHSIEDYETLQPDSWGIPTPSMDSISGREDCLKNLEEAGDNANNRILDLIVMPGMAFDINMDRLGHGKGFYDFFLRRYQDKIKNLPKKAEMPFLVGLALEEQVLAKDQDIPTDTSDWPLDALIIGDGRFLRRAQS